MHTAAFSSQRKGKGVAIDLDVEGGDDSASDEAASLQQKSMNELAVLKTKLQSCSSCGPNFFCKGRQDNKHKHLMHHQAQSLVHIHACVDIVC
jgi:hypothetical protein